MCKNAKMQNLNATKFPYPKTANFVCSENFMFYGRLNILRNNGQNNWWVGAGRWVEKARVYDGGLQAGETVQVSRQN